MYTDTHVHVWKLSRGDYGWLKPENTVLYRDYLPDMLAPHLAAEAVEQVVLVQAAATLAETEFMLELADRTGWIAGVVGGLQPFDEGFRSDYGEVKGRKKWSGLRWNGTLFREASSGTNGETKLLATMRQLSEDGCVLDLLILPGDLPHVLPFAEAVPELAIVLNHLGGPGRADVEEGNMQPWQREMAQLAACSNVHCKISGTITMAAGFHPEKLAAYVNHLFEVFGSQRLMFGSDWPVALLGGSYEEVVRLFEALLPSGLREDEKAAVRSYNAKRVYKLAKECAE